MNQGNMAQEYFIRDKRKCIKVITLLLREYTPVLKDALSKIHLKGHAFESHIRWIKILNYISTLPLHDADFDTLSFLAEFLLIFTRSFFKVPGYEYKNVVTLSAIIDETLNGLFGEKNNTEKNKFFANKILQWIHTSKNVQKNAFKQNTFTTLIDQDQSSLKLNSENWIPQPSNHVVVKTVRRLSCGSRDSCKHLLVDPRVNRKLNANTQSALNNSHNLCSTDLNKPEQLQQETRLSSSTPVCRGGGKSVESLEQPTGRQLTDPRLYMKNLSKPLEGNSDVPNRASYRHSLNRRLTEEISSFYKVGSKDAVRKEPKILEKSASVPGAGELVPGLHTTDPHSSEEEHSALKSAQSDSVQDNCLPIIPDHPKKTSSLNTNNDDQESSPSVDNTKPNNGSSEQNKIAKISKLMVKEVDSVDHKELDLAFSECLKEFDKPFATESLTLKKQFNKVKINSAIQECIKDFDNRCTRKVSGNQLKETVSNQIESSESNSSSTRLLRSRRSNRNSSVCSDELLPGETSSNNENSSISSSSLENSKLRKKKPFTKESVNPVPKNEKLNKNVSRKSLAGSEGNVTSGESIEDCTIKDDSDSSTDLESNLQKAQKLKKTKNLKWIESSSSENESEEINDSSFIPLNDEMPAQISNEKDRKSPPVKTKNCARKKIPVSDEIEPKNKVIKKKEMPPAVKTDDSENTVCVSQRNLRSRYRLRKYNMSDDDTEGASVPLHQPRRSARIKVKDAVIKNEATKPKSKQLAQESKGKMSSKSVERNKFEITETSSENSSTSGESDGESSTGHSKTSDDTESSTCQLKTSDDTESSTCQLTTSDEPESSTCQLATSDDTESSTCQLTTSDVTESSTCQLATSDDADSFSPSKKTKAKSPVPNDLSHVNNSGTTINPVEPLNLSGESSSVCLPLDLTSKETPLIRPILVTHIFTKKNIIYTDPTIFGNPKEDATPSVTDIEDEKMPIAKNETSRDTEPNQELPSPCPSVDAATSSITADDDTKVTKEVSEGSTEECPVLHSTELDDNFMDDFREPNHVDDVDEKFNSVLRNNYECMGSKLDHIFDPFYNCSDPSIKIKGNKFIYDLEERLGVKVCSKIALNGETLLWAGCTFNKKSFTDLVKRYEPKSDEETEFINECRISVGCFEAKQVSSSIFKYFCSYPDCDFSSSNTSLFVRHIEVFHDRCEFQSSCDICNFNTDSLIAAFEHLHSHYGPLEAETFYSSSEERNEIMSKILSFDAPNAQHTFSNLQRISPDQFMDMVKNSEDSAKSRRRVITHNTNLVTYKYLIDYYKCFGCKFSCNEFSLFKGHFLQHFMTDRQTEKALWQMCAFCGDEMDLFRMNHSVVKHGMSMYQCPLCLYRAVSGVYVAIHKILSHKESDNRVIKLFNHPTGQVTKPSYHSIKPYICFHKYCSFETCIISKYVDHLWSHTFRHLACFECGARFFSANQLLQHLEDHSLTLLHCAFCPFSFQDIHSAIKHLVISHPSLPTNIIVREDFTAWDNKPREHVDYFPLDHEVGETILALDFGNWLSNCLTYKTCFLKDPKGIIKATRYDIYLFCEEIDPSLYENSYEVTVTVRPSEVYFNEVNDEFRAGIMKQISLPDISGTNGEQSYKATGNELNISGSFHLKSEGDIESIKERLLERMKEEVFKECGVNNIESFRQQILDSIRDGYVKKIKSANIDSLMPHILANIKPDREIYDCRNENVPLLASEKNEVNVKLKEEPNSSETKTVEVFSSVQSNDQVQSSSEEDRPVRPDSSCSSFVTEDDINESDITTFTEIYDDIASSCSSTVVKNAGFRQSSHEETKKIISKIRQFLVKSCGFSLQEIDNRIKSADFKNLQCWHCGSFHLTLSGLVEHSSCLHPSESLTFVTDKDISLYLEISDGAPLTICSICSKLFKLKGELLCHYLHHHQELKINYAHLIQKFACRYCRLCFENHSLAVEHIKTVHSSSLNRGKKGSKRLKTEDEQQPCLLAPKTVFSSELSSSTNKFILSEKLNSTELKHYIMSQKFEDEPGEESRGMTALLEEKCLDFHPTKENCSPTSGGPITNEVFPAQKRAFARKSTGMKSKSPYKCTAGIASTSPSIPNNGLQEQSIENDVLQMQAIETVATPNQSIETDPIQTRVLEGNFHYKDYHQNENSGEQSSRSGKRIVFCAKGKVPQTARKSTYSTIFNHSMSKPGNQVFKVPYLPIRSAKEEVLTKLKLGNRQRKCKLIAQSKMNQPKVPAERKVVKNRSIETPTAAIRVENLHDEVDINGRMLRVCLADLKSWF